MAVVLLFAVLLLFALLNLIDSISLPLRPVDPVERLTPAQLALQRFLTWMTIAVVALIGPYGFFLGKKQRDIKAIERRLPDFLRDVAEAGRFRLAPAEAVLLSSNGPYEALDPLETELDAPNRTSIAPEAERRR